MTRAARDWLFCLGLFAIFALAIYYVHAFILWDGAWWRWIPFWAPWVRAVWLLGMAVLSAAGATAAGYATAALLPGRKRGGLS
ncbi:hypothetical protein [Parvibaculum sp. MBR-TMA-1.3b-4.2]|jgi:hypothetical protein